MSKSLEKRVHGLSASDLLGIDREMTINDMPAKCADDMVMYWYLGSKLYVTLLESSFRYACIEADYLKKETGSKDWLRLQENAKTRMWKAIYKAFPDLETRDFTNLQLQPHTDAQMRQTVEQKYRRNGGQMGNDYSRN